MNLVSVFGHILCLTVPAALYRIIHKIFCYVIRKFFKVITKTWIWSQCSATFFARSPHKRDLNLAVLLLFEECVVVTGNPASLAHQSTPHEHPLVCVEEWLDFSGHFSLPLSCYIWLV